MKFLFHCYVLLAVFFVAGCASMGTPIDEAFVGSIENGKTTEQALIAHLGQPLSVTTSGDERVLSYLYSKSKVSPSTFVPMVGAFAGDVNTDLEMLSVHVDTEGIVQDAVFVRSNQNIKTGLAAYSQDDRSSIDLDPD